MASTSSHAHSPATRSSDEQIAPGELDLVVVGSLPTERHLELNHE
jgi:hypothetical protein